MAGRTATDSPAPRAVQPLGSLLPLLHPHCSCTALSSPGNSLQTAIWTAHIKVSPWTESPPRMTSGARGRGRTQAARPARRGHGLAEASGGLGGGSPDSQTGALPQPPRAPGPAALPFHAGQDWLLRTR